MSAKPQFGMMYGWVLEQPGLTLIDVKTYWALTLNAYHGVVKGKSLNDIAKQAGHDARKVRDSIKKLEALGAITVERTFSSLGYATNVYTIVSGVGTEQSVPRDSAVPTLGTVESGGWGPSGQEGRDSTVRTTTPDQNQTKNTDTQTDGGGVREPDWTRGEGAKAAAPEYAYNKYRGKCTRCGRQLETDQGQRLGKNEQTQKWEIACHDGECKVGYRQMPAPVEQPTTTTTPIATHQPVDITAFRRLVLERTSA